MHPTDADPALSDPALSNAVRPDAASGDPAPAGPAAFAEANFDGLVGPTHNYAGLSPGNLASQSNRGVPSGPKKAALQGLAKARRLADLGVPQHVLPPHERPSLALLRRLGFGRPTEAETLAAAAEAAPHLLAAACSASAMWAANAATVSPAPDTADGRLHLTAANLAFNTHRAQEAAFTARVLRAVFADEGRFAVHDPLPGTPAFSDEGAANHTRFAAAHGEPGVELFCFGRGERPAGDRPKRLPARQHESACRAVARLHGLDPARTVFARQSARAIDAGVFHNDVIAVGNEDVLFYHAAAFADEDETLDELRRALGGAPLAAFRVNDAELALEDAVETYLFNSQLVTLPGHRDAHHDGHRDGHRADADGRMVLIAPAECERHPDAAAACERLVRDLPQVGRVEFVDVRESMRNGGGPACLRLRVAMTPADRAALAGSTALTPALHDRLVAWVERHYRDELAPADLADPALITESRDALDELTTILALGSLYDFQR